MTDTRKEAKAAFDPAADMAKRLRDVYGRWNEPSSEALPEGAGVMLEAADLLEAVARERDEARAEAKEHLRLKKELVLKAYPAMDRADRLAEALEQIGVYGCGMLNQPAAMNGPEEAWLRRRLAEYERVARAALAATQTGVGER